MEKIKIKVHIFSKNENETNDIPVKDISHVLEQENEIIISHMRVQGEEDLKGELGKGFNPPPGIIPNLVVFCFDYSGLDYKA